MIQGGIVRITKSYHISGGQTGRRKKNQNLKKVFFFFGKGRKVILFVCWRAGELTEEERGRRKERTSGKKKGGKEKEKEGEKGREGGKSWRWKWRWILREKEWNPLCLPCSEGLLLLHLFRPLRSAIGLTVGISFRMVIAGWGGLLPRLLLLPLLPLLRCIVAVASLAVRVRDGEKGEGGEDTAVVMVMTATRRRGMGVMRTSKRRRRRNNENGRISTRTASARSTRRSCTRCVPTAGPEARLPGGDIRGTSGCLRTRWIGQGGRTWRGICSMLLR